VQVVKSPTKEITWEGRKSSIIMFQTNKPSHLRNGWWTIHLVIRSLKFELVRLMVLYKRTIAIFNISSYMSVTPGYVHNLNLSSLCELIGRCVLCSRVACWRIHAYGCSY